MPNLHRKITAISILMLCTACDIEEDPQTSRSQDMSSQADLGDTSTPDLETNRADMFTPIKDANGNLVCVTGSDFDSTTCDPSICHGHGGVIYEVDDAAKTCKRTNEGIAVICAYTGTPNRINGRGLFYKKVGERYEYAEFNLAFEDLKTDWTSCQIPGGPDACLFCPSG